MAISDTQFTEWLEDQSAVRCVLVDAVANVSGADTTRYLSTTGYVTGGSDTPANTDYLPIISGGVSFTESLDIEAKASLSFGNIELSNPSGEYDEWLNDVWVNRQIQVFIGDVRWARADFRLIFDGISADISSPGIAKLSISVRDKLQRLNTPVHDVLLGGTTANKDRLLPICMGEVFNVTPLLSNPATHEYIVHARAVEDIIEVRDNGVPVDFTKNNPAGKFTLDQNPHGTITASVQGDKPMTYSNTIADLIQILVTDGGKVSEQFTASDIDTANFTAFNSANPQPVGSFFNVRTNVLKAVNDLAASVGAQAVMSRAGLLRLLKVELPATGADGAITTDDIEENSLKIIARTGVRASIKLGFCKNYTVQNGIQTGIPEDNKVLFSEQWLDRVATDTSTATQYKLDAEPKRKETQLLVQADADVEAQRLLDFFKVPRTTYSFNGGVRLIEMQLGDKKTLTHPRFGLSSGVDGMVVMLKIDWLKFKVSMGVIT